MSLRGAKNQLFLQAVGTVGIAPYHWCKKPLLFDEATVDHLKPKLVGGKDQMSNYVLACRECNCQRSKDTSRQGNIIKLWKWHWWLRISLAEILNEETDNG